MSVVTMSGCKVCVVNPRTSKFGEYCRSECRNVGEAYSRGEYNERNRIADALEREAARREILRETYFARTFAEFAERLRKGEV